MKEAAFVNPILCKKAIETLRVYLDEGLEDMNTLSRKIVVSPSKVQCAINQFDAYSDKGGYYSNIISYPHFSQLEIEVIRQYL